MVIINACTRTVGYTEMAECPKCKTVARFLWKISKTTVWLLIVPIPSETNYVLCLFCNYTQDIKVKKTNGKYFIIPGQLHLVDTTSASSVLIPQEKPLGVPVQSGTPERGEKEKAMDVGKDEIKGILEKIKASVEKVLSLDIKSNYMQFQKELTRIHTLVDILESVTIADDENGVNKNTNQNEINLLEQQCEQADANADRYSQNNPDNSNTVANLNNQEIKLVNQLKECPACGKMTLRTLSKAPLMMGCGDKNCANYFKIMGSEF